MNQTLAMKFFRSTEYAVGRPAWRFLRALGAATDRAFSALVRFWSIPVLGADETRESRHFRAKQYI